MINRLQPYPDYKDSGLPWIGKVPGRWDVLPLAHLARQKSIINQSQRQLLSVYLHRGVVRFTDVEEKRTNSTSEDLSHYQAVDPGDFVLNNQQAWRGSVGVSSLAGIVSPAYLVLSLSDRFISRYANLLFRDQCTVAQYLVCSKGVGTIQRNLYWPHLKRVGVIVPPPDEQVAIVNFMDWANGRLERAIRAKRKIIALLNEQKQAIIYRAVTRGLNPDVKLKPSDVLWLGNIPAHWEVRRVKSLSPVKRGASPRPIDDMRFFDEHGEYAWVRISDVTSSNQYLEKTTERLSALGKSRSVPLEPGTVFLSIAGSVGKPIITKIKCCIHDGFVYFPRFKGNTLYLSYLFSSGRVYEGLGKFGTQLNLNTETVGSIRLPWPTTAEQSTIVGYLDKELRKYDIATDRIEKEISLLREYRTRLVADVVTGKLDVREAAKNLPDEAAEPEAKPDAEELSDSEPEEVEA